MPKNFPKAPPPLLAATLAPLAWAWGCPDLFDSYSAGMILMQASHALACCRPSAPCLPPGPPDTGDSAAFAAAAQRSPPRPRGVPRAVRQLPHPDLLAPWALTSPPCGPGPTATP